MSILAIIRAALCAVAGPTPARGRSGLALQPRLRNEPLNPPQLFVIILIISFTFDSPRENLRRYGARPDIHGDVYPRDGARDN